VGGDEVGEDDWCDGEGDEAADALIGEMDPAPFATTAGGSPTRVREAFFGGGRRRWRMRKVAPVAVGRPKIDCLVVSDATKITATGFGGPEVACATVFGVLFFDKSIPDLWLHVEKTSGHFSEVKDVEQRVVAACLDAGLNVTMLATDGDPATSPRHTKVWNLYRFKNESTAALSEIVSSLEAAGAFTSWPVSDFLHLLKNMRMRLIHRPLTDGMGGHEFSRQSLQELLGVVPGLRDVSASSAMHDADALALFRESVIRQCIEGGEWEAARWLMPWTLLAIVIREPLVSRPARLQLLSVAFSIFFIWSKRKPKAGVRQWREKADRGAVAFADNDHLRRACNLCIALYYAIKRYDAHGLALGRIGSHACEAHFGTIRSVLRGHTRFRSWVSAEAFAKVIDSLTDDVGVSRRPRRSRTVGGCDIPATELEDSALFAQPIQEDPTRLHALACGFARGDRDECIDFWLLISQWLAGIASALPPSDFAAGPFTGLGCNARRFK
jgi:hypothetical protein